uniref:ubiquitinyl hydrolase 1 n=1 Tax=Taeniopygia guttata TaxID=59729 RepID=A0A674GYV9_TAEGU
LPEPPAPFSSPPNPFDPLQPTTTTRTHCICNPQLTRPPPINRRPLITLRPLERLSLPHVLGLLLNVPSRVRLGALALPLCRPHWLCVRRLGDTFYNLDSKLPAPAAIGSETQLREFLRTALAPDTSELLLVVAPEVEEQGTWLRPE